MKQKRNITWAVLILPALVAFGTRGDDVSFHPKSGSSLSKTFVNESEIALDDMTMNMNGQEMDASAMGMEMTTTAKVTVAFTDRFDTVEDGRPTKLTRTFDELGSSTTVEMSNAMMGDMDTDMSGVSELEGLSVVFMWDDEAEEYDVSFAEDSAGDAELLEGLEGSMDLLGMLPGKEVSEGDTWSIEPVAIRALFAPAGAVKIEMEGVEEMMGMSGPQPSADQMLGDFEGDVTATYTGTRDMDGTVVAAVQIAIDVSSAKDLTELMEEMMADAPMPEGMEIEMDVEAFDMEFAFEGKGELLWNVEAGHIYALDLSGDLEQNIDMAMNMSMGGGEQAIEQSMMLSGTQRVMVSTSTN